MELFLIVTTAACLGIAKGVAIVHGVLSCYPALGHVGPVVRKGKGSAFAKCGAAKTATTKATAHAARKISQAKDAVMHLHGSEAHIKQICSGYH